LSERKSQSEEPTNKIFVKNLPYDVDEDAVGDFFKKCGTVTNVRLIYNSLNNNFKG
jgi:RNA recognition motif-containing protein